MSNFNPNKHRSAEDWQELAVESIEKGDSNFGVGGAIIAGLVLGAIANPLTGVLGAGLILYNSFRKTFSVNTTEEAIREYGCVAPFLTGNNLKDYILQVGQDEAIDQITWAQERGYEISSDAKALVPKQLPPSSEKAVNPVDRVVAAVRPMLSNYRDADNRLVGRLQAMFASSRGDETNTQDLIAAIATRPRNHLIIGQQGCGKGVTVSNALSAIKAKNPRLTIYYIDPKGDDKETGYFGSVDVLERGKALEWKDSKTIEWFKAKFHAYMRLPSPKLLIFDEATSISILMKNGGESGWLKGAITKLTSLGDSGQTWVWILAQNPHCEDFGVSGGLRSQFTALALVHKSNLASYKAIKKTSWLPVTPSIDEIIQLCEDSPCDRAFFYGQFNEWLPMPKLPNPSGYDRDSDSMTEQDLPTDSPTDSPKDSPKNIAEDAQDSSDDNVQDSQPQRPSKLSEMAQKLLDYLIRTERTEASVKDIQPSFKVGGERFKSEQIRQWLNEIVSVSLAVWTDENTIKIGQTDGQTDTDTQTDN